jgi:hypothetical protein
MNFFGYWNSRYAFRQCHHWSAKLMRIATGFAGWDTGSVELLLFGQWHGRTPPQCQHYATLDHKISFLQPIRYYVTPSLVATWRNFATDRWDWMDTIVIKGLLTCNFRSMVSLRCGRSSGTTPTFVIWLEFLDAPVRGGNSSEQH